MTADQEVAGSIPAERKIYLPLVAQLEERLWVDGSTVSLEDISAKYLPLVEVDTSNCLNRSSHTSYFLFYPFFFPLLCFLIFLVVLLLVKYLI